MSTEEREGKRANKLAEEKSPYLRQHAGNPVAWQSWNADAFEMAAVEDKPIFLSIGYSTCHWCHVMAHESFADARVAELLNRDFVSIKVDREERPDIDGFYMSACQALTGSGGWPLTVIMTPEKKPFFAGTYFPKETKYGLIGMVDLIPRVAEMWCEQRDDIEKSGSELVELLRAQADSQKGEEPGEAVLSLAFRQLADRFDSSHGGFGAAPKFPSPHNLTFLLRYYARTGSETAVQMVDTTLAKMRRGGIYDHVGFGFHRYSTDVEWKVPHFEKMLYDQALIAIAYLEGCQATGRSEYGEVAREIFTYVQRDMTGKGGGFYSAEDADTEGEEGKYYVWSEAELRAALDEEEFTLVKHVFSVDDPAGNVLYQRKAGEELAADLDLPLSDLNEQVRGVLRKLLKAREARVRPHRDDKILADWNGLMIAALAKGARVLDEPAYARAARAAADFVATHFADGQGGLLHRYRDGEAAISGYLDDYAFMAWGLLELYEATYDPEMLERAFRLSEEMIVRFWDDAGGAFFHTVDADETLFVRRKEAYDGALPAGNSVAALVLIKLARMTVRPEFEEKCRHILRAVSRSLSDTPIAHTHLLGALNSLTGPSQEVVVVGDPRADDTRELIKVLRESFRPNMVTLLRDSTETEPAGSVGDEFVRNMNAVDGKAAAYVCVNHACVAPTVDPRELRDALSGAASGAASSA